MIRKIYSIIRGRNIWEKFKRKYAIDEKTVVIILTENNEEWNASALNYLPDYMKRTNAGRAIVLYINKALSNESLFNISNKYIVDNITYYQAKQLINYYCFHRFFDKIVFFYLNYPQDNRSARILDSTDVTIDELVCLGFYRLREVPAHV